MTAIVFVGPSLGRVSFKLPPGVVLAPPAACGDVARAVQDGASAIGLIDGLFETTAAPWPQEMLFALSRGVPVMGAASMGALRAVECEAFGMIGVGRVFRAYRAGRIRADDEVAVLHGPREAGYVPVSEALVNVRATLARAERMGVLGQRQHALVLAAAQDLYWKDRNWDLILKRSVRAGLAVRVAHRLGAWVEDHAVDVKRLDARLLLRRMPDLLRARLRRRPVFVRTKYWVDFCAHYRIKD
jgi:hypothetical protein